MAIGFDVWEGEGSFTHPAEPFDRLVDEFDALRDRRDAGQLAHTAYVSALEKLVARQPDFIDGHAHLGYALLDQGKPRKALEACLRGVAAGDAVIPPGFTGPIPWGCLENRPFLRALHGAVLCQLRLRRRRDAVSLMERLLALNPGDNQGVRFLLGSEYLRLDRPDKARPLFEAEAHAYPPYDYELALLHIRAGNWVAAATALRRGFAANGYIAEILGGNPDPAPLPLWHGSNFAEPEIAREYVGHHGDLWNRTPYALAFVRWLHSHPKILIERATILECQGELLWEHDVGRRRPLVARLLASRDAIDDRLLDEIVQQRTDRSGRSMHPWQYQPAAAFR